MFKKLLIANRGEIACRVIATARRLGIATVAVYSEADARALHVSLADEAWPVGPAPARQSYLSVERILDAARRSGAEAIHPGYGFLSESAAFAAACAEAGIVFVGPPAEAIRAMGSKAAAKRLMGEAGVPLVPGYHGEAQDLPTLAAAAAGIGYPILVKASAGGGGKGMRIAERPDALEEAVSGAKREALSAFGDDHVLLERYLTQPRHIEVQVFADTRGNTVSLFERDCSIQRRHQKVVEEAPAPGMAAERRRAMGEAACAAARAVGYVGAGTVEFIVAAASGANAEGTAASGANAEGTAASGGSDKGTAASGAGNGSDDAFYFMEMNTRLQVEHPVTELVTGLDLVEWQLRVAAGEPLPARPDAPRGHAIEARIYAEDPARDFLPSTGTLAHLRQPRPRDGVRVDTGVREGDAITPYYDPMIAKLIVWGEDRAAAVQRLAGALAEYEVVGVQTNLALLRAIAASPAFAAAELDTGFIARHAADLTEPPVARDAESVIWAAASVAVLEDQRAAEAAQAAASGDPWSPWAAADSWRLNGDGYQDLTFRRDGQTCTLRAHPGPGRAFRLDLASGPVLVEGSEDDTGMALRVDGVLRALRVVRHGAGLVVILAGRLYPVSVVDPLAPPRQESAGDDRVTAPIPARVARVLVEPGDRVAKGAPLVVLEAMKMELTLSAPAAGTVEIVAYGVDEMVTEGAELVTLAISSVAPL